MTQEAVRHFQRRSLRDSFSFMAREADDVARAGSGAGRKFVRAEELSDDVARIPTHEPKPFKVKKGHNDIEFDRQLANQEADLNKLTVQEYLDNRELYLKYKRSPEAKAAQKLARKEAFEDKIFELTEQGMDPNLAKKEAKKWIDTQAALHDPDMIAGGFGENVTGMGDKRINSSIGAQWKARVKEMDDHIRALAENMSADERANTLLDIRLSRI